MSTKEEQKQHLIDIMRGDEELGLYEVANKLYPKYISDPYNPTEDLNKEERDIWIEGAKWQQEQNKKCYHPLPYRLAKSDFNFECTLCGKFI